MAKIEVNLLGPVGVTVDGAPARLNGPQSRLLLARLAIAAPNPVSTDALVDTIWPDEPPASARKSVQKHVSSLRRALGPETLSTEDQGYSLTLEPDAVDTHRFDHLISRGASARARGDERGAWRLYEEALQLWHGSPMDGLADRPFVADATARLQHQRLTALEDKLEAGLAIGEAPLEELRDLVHRHPMRERLRACLMIVLYRSGRQAEALAQYRDLRQTLGTELGIEPSPALADLEERILLQDPHLMHKRDRRKTNLPSTFTSFVGRDDAIDALAMLLRSARMVTLVGPGGSGKTRLAIRVAEDAVARYADGAWFIDLVAVTSPHLVEPTIAAALQVAIAPNSSVRDQLIDALDGQQTLLIIDNAEHVSNEVAGLVRALMDSTPGVTILTTSRSPLGLTGEVVWPVAPLQTPEDGADTSSWDSIDAVRLFLDRAEAANPLLVLSPGDAPVVIEICRRLDGLPLAIELAARQLHGLSLAQLSEQLVDRLDVLAAPGEPDVRHRTMDAAIAWSYGLLSDEQRTLLGLISVFPGSFTAAAACSVARQVVDAEADPTLKLLTGLVSQSMIELDLATDRFRLLEPIRSYARLKSNDDGHATALPRAYAHWVLELLERHSPILGPDERTSIEVLAQEHHHFPAAHSWAVEHDPELALRLVVAAMDYVAMVVYRFAWAEDMARSIAKARAARSEVRAEALAKCALALAENNADSESALKWAVDALNLAPDDPHVTPFAELAVGLATRNKGALGQAVDWIKRGMASFDVVGPPSWAARARHSLAFAEVARGNYRRAVEVCREALEIWSEVGSDWGTGKAWWVIAAAEALEGDHEAAEVHASTAYEYFRGFPDPGSLAHLLAVRGDAARLSGRTEEAEAIYLECLEQFREVRDGRCLASTLKNLGLVALASDRPAQAGRLLAAALERRSGLGDEAGIAECLVGIGMLAAEHGDPRDAVRLLNCAEKLRMRNDAQFPESERIAANRALESARTMAGIEDLDHADDLAATITHAHNVIRIIEHRFDANLRRGILS